MKPFRDVSEMRAIVVNTVYAIPSGRVASYGQIAALAGYPNHARLVGTVLKQLPSATTIPWHRVVNSQGRLSLVATSDAYQMQLARLVDEGVDVVAGKINLRVFGWCP